MEDADLIFIINKLKLAGRVWTPQRQALYDLFIKITEPTDAETIWLRLRASGYVISRDTVYNTLRLLTSLGFAERKLNPETKILEFNTIKKNKPQ